MTSMKLTPTNIDFYKTNYPELENILSKQQAYINQTLLMEHKLPFMSMTYPTEGKSALYIFSIELNGRNKEYYDYKYKLQQS